jgi:uncharacterized protein (TIGR02145 family)
VYAAALDPSSPAMFDQMPGELLGGMNDSLRLLRSFGMAAVELRDANMNELQLAQGTSATLTFNIPSALQADAPETIDWWSFDETLGYWKHEGEAIKQGNQYIGQASHFSWWNLDVPGTFNEFQGIVNSTDGNPISSAQIVLISPTFGSGLNYTNSVGAFSGRVPKNQALTLNINLICNTTNDWALAHSETVISEDDSISGSYIAELNGFYPLSGIVVNCEGLPVESGYVTMGPQIFFTESGNFTIQTCQTGEYTLRGFNTINPDSIKVSEIITVQVESTGTDAGNLPTCSTMFSSVTDIDGNVYETVLIGNQWWMAENLKSTHFSDGSEIPNVIENYAWAQLTTPAWCNYDNNVLNDSLYGKLYNFYAVIDPSGLCPVSWHVPSNAEWTELTNYLGGPEIAGVRMKSELGWDEINTIITNEIGFSGLPGGKRIYEDLDFTGINGDFFGIGSACTWWSSSQSDDANAWILSLSKYHNNTNIQTSLKLNGYSVRCVKD